MSELPHLRLPAQRFAWREKLINVGPSILSGVKKRKIKGLHLPLPQHL